ncbi:MAG: hypothetical protein NXH75_15515 [Halobacteriovoraceae bacterium]|nr:hypothetical protein [Halobacteriovoraceae bacterium]
MEMKINAFIPLHSHYKKVEVFGYTSRSQPGLEILGLSTKGRSIKEKITYLSKRRKLKFSLLKYVLCVEGDDLTKGDIEYLELPLLLCFWTMAGIIKMGRLDNCLCAGKVSLEGDIEPLEIPEEILEKWNEGLQERGRVMMMIGSSNSMKHELSQLKLLEVSELLKGSVGGFNVVA